jgi:putative DNA primase/helicase
MEWQREGLNPPEVVLSATEDYFEAEDTFKMFLEECCLTGHEGYEEPVALLHVVHRAWKEGRGERALGTKTFSQRLQKYGFHPGKDALTRTKRVFRGLRLSDGERRRAQALLDGKTRPAETENDKDGGKDG